MYQRPWLEMPSMAINRYCALSRKICNYYDVIIKGSRIMEMEWSDIFQYHSQDIPDNLKNWVLNVELSCTKVVDNENYMRTVV